MIIDFYQSEHFDSCHPSRAYEWVRLMFVSRMWKATILSFPSLWSKLFMNSSVPQSKILTVLERSKSHPLQVVIPPPVWSEEYPKSTRYKYVDLAAELLPRISYLAISTCGEYDTPRIYRAFKGRSSNQLQRLSFVTVPAPRLDKLFVLYAPHLRSLHLSGVESWPPSMAENITHIRLNSNLNPEALEGDLKNSPRLKEIRLDGVYYTNIGIRSKVSLIPGVRLIITGSRDTVAHHFILGSTNYLSITTGAAIVDFSANPILKLTLPQDISCFRNLNDLTVVHLKLIDSGEGPYTHMDRNVTVILRCSTADRETLHIEVKYTLSSLWSPRTMEPEIIPERPPAMRALNYLRPLNLRKVVELRMEGFVGEWGLQSFELCHFLQHMPALRRIVTGDDNKEIFWFALSTTRRSTSVIVEGV